MKTLLILRHGKSSWDHPDLPDHDRPLKERGRRDAPRMGKLLKEERLVPESIVCSTAERACRTTELVAEHCGYSGTIQYTDTLYHGSLEDFTGALNDVSGNPDPVLIVGHNPGLEELVRALTGQEERLPTAALARVSLPIERWNELTLGTKGALEDVWRPKALR